MISNFKAAASISSVPPLQALLEQNFPKAYVPQLSYYAHGKLLITGEYLLLHGAKSLSVPTKLGQSLEIRKRDSHNPKLFWRSLDHQGNIWFSAIFDLWHFHVELAPQSSVQNASFQFLQTVLKQARLLNPHFLRDEHDIFVETKLEFPINWGLGSSSSLVAMIAQWAQVGAFDLHQRVGHGSGYDVACAMAPGPITYQLTKLEGQMKKTSWSPSWSIVPFSPRCKDQLYFVYQGAKQDTQKELVKFLQKDFNQASISQAVTDISQITEEIMIQEEIGEFQKLIKHHDEIMSKVLDRPRLKDQLFADFHGEVKPLGAWGGDFCLAASSMSDEETRDYFKHKGHSIILSFDETVNFNLDHINAGRIH
jgi:mevalonate kinase